MNWLPIIFAGLQFVFIGIGLQPKYKYKSLFTTWPDWAVIISFAGAMISGAVWLITK